MKTWIAALTTSALLAAHAAGVPVIDVSVLAKVTEDVRLAIQQLEEIQTLVGRMGDPADVQLEPVRDLLVTLRRLGVGVGLDDLQQDASGLEGILYEAHGLYRSIDEVVTTADGVAFPRVIDEYRKFNAATRTRFALEDVMADTEERRQAVRDQILLTTMQLQASQSFAEVAKLHALLTAQSAELAAIDRERDAALARLLAQQAENQTDAARQDRARLEERMVDFRVATEKLGQFLRPDPTPVRIPDPGSPRL